MRLGEPTGGLTSPGIPVIEVHSGSAAARAGLKPGDVLITLDGRWTTSIPDVFHAAADVSPGRETTVVIHRDGKEQTLTVPRRMEHKQRKHQGPSDSNVWYIRRNEWHLRRD